MCIFNINNIRINKITASEISAIQHSCNARTCKRLHKDT